MAETGGKTYDYDTRLNVLHGPLETIDLATVAATVTHPWFNQTLCRVNDAVVRVGMVKGEYHWHKHDEDDEFFYVVSGQFIIEMEGSSITLGSGQAFVVPKGVMHRPRAPRRTVILMVETAAIMPTGD